MNWKRRAVLILLGVILFLGGIVALGYWQADEVVDFLWFQSLGYSIYYMQRLFMPYIVAGTITLLFFLFFSINFRFALGRFPKGPSPKEEAPAEPKILKKPLKRSGIRQVFFFLGLILAFLIAQPFLKKWEMFLFYILGPKAGYTDTVFNNDISYYLFSYPVYQLIQERLFFIFLIFAAALIVIYWIDYRKYSSPGDPLRKGVRMHMSLVFVLIFVLGIWELILQRHEFLYSRAHEPLFSGPGAVEMKFMLPIVWALVVLLILILGAVVNYITRRKGLGTLFSLFVLFLLCLGARYSNVVPYMAQTYLIESNINSWERPYIEHNIKSTLRAFNLDKVEVRNFDPNPRPEKIESPHVKDVLQNIPVWDAELLGDVYHQHQELRNYYTFPDVHVGRYQIEGKKKQVFLAARELDATELPSDATNWINSHMTYTHGYGAVMTSASQKGNDNFEWLISGIPPRSKFGLDIKQPGIYYGLGKYNYSIAPNSANEIDYPMGNDNVKASYSGEGGVSVGSLWRKALFSFYFDDRNILFTTKTTRKSKILFRRNLVERIKTVTPFLYLDRNPYLVVTEERLYWIQDAYTVSDLYPYAATQQFGGRQINYIRNSIKIVMDAYSGKIDYYICDRTDPIAAALGRIYPTLFKSFDRFPQDLRAHVRYPQDIFETQMRIYARYHQTNPDVFYQGEDIWKFAPTGMNEENGREKAYYAMVDLVKPGRLDFILMLPMIGKKRENLRALPIVSCDDPDYGKIIIYNFPKGNLVFGPSQINAFIDQDTDVAQQFTLWDQAGSEVKRGKMIILMVDRTMLYVQPVYLQSSRHTKIPELQRVIMSQGQVIVMQPSIEEAYAELRYRLTGHRSTLEDEAAPAEKPEPEDEGEPEPEEVPTSEDAVTDVPNGMDMWQFPYRRNG